MSSKRNNKSDGIEYDEINDEDDIEFLKAGHEDDDVKEPKLKKSKKAATKELKPADINDPNLVFQACLPNKELLVKIVESIKEMVSGTSVYFDDTGLKLQTMDHSKVAMIKIHLTPDAFVTDSFHCKEYTRLGIDMASLFTVLKIAHANDTIQLSYNNTNPDALQFFFSGERRKAPGIFDKQCPGNLKLIDVQEDMYDIPEILPLASVTMASADFHRIVQEARTGKEDSIRIQVTPSKIVFKVNSVLFDCSLNFDANEDDPQSIQIAWNETDESEKKVYEASYSLRYLNFFAKAAPVSDIIVLNFVKGEPLSVKYPLDAGAGSIAFYLSQKIIGMTDEDDDATQE